MTRYDLLDVLVLRLACSIMSGSVSRPYAAYMVDLHMVNMFRMVMVVDLIL